LITGGLIALIDCGERKGRWGGGRARRGLRGGAGSIGWREEEERKGGEGRLTGGARMSASRGKRKEEETRWAGAGKARRAAWAVWAEREAGAVFFLLLFQTSFSNHFSSQIQFKLFQTFSQEFYKLFRNHTSNQNPCKPTDDAQSLVVSKFIKLCLIF
jgi:hypothetical protein